MEKFGIKACHMIYYIYAKFLYANVTRKSFENYILLMPHYLIFGLTSFFYYAIINGKKGNFGIELYKIL